MKKIIYSVIVITGLLLIASNFMVDRKNIDHKKASASGTACRWISDTGYGLGPHYITSTTCTDTNCDKETNRPLGDFIDIIPCNSDNSSDKKDGNKIYNKTDSNSYVPYTGYIRFSAQFGGTAKHAMFLKIDSGTVKELKSFTTSATAGYNTTGGKVVTNPQLFTYYAINLQPLSKDDKWWNYQSTYDTYPIGVDEWIFTCVCAEY